MTLDYNATVSQRDEIAPGLMILRVVPDLLPFAFRAGQYTVLGLRESEPSVACDADLPGAAGVTGVAGVEATGGDAAVEGTGAIAGAHSLGDAAAVETGGNGDEPAPAAEASSSSADKLIRRAYSIASSSRAEEFLEFYLALVPSGELTPKLFHLQLKDRLYVGPKATGMFTLGRVPEDRDILLVATGTGLAPYMSMLRSEIACGAAQRIVVLHGARYSWDLAYRTELMTLSRVCVNLHYLPVVSRPGGDPTWRGLTGYLQDVLLSGEVERDTGVPIDPARTHVFLCGNPHMIEAARERLVEERGYVPDHKKEVGTLHVEEYW